MGCATSKENRVCRKCKGAVTPPTRSKSMHVHHPPEWLGDSYHLVGRTFSDIDCSKLNDDDEKGKLNGSMDLSTELVEAKTWSEMMDKTIPRIIPRTPIRTPPGEPEPINAWELMEGLDDITPLRPAHHPRSFSFGVAIDNSTLAPPDSPEPATKVTKPLWLEIAEKESNSNSNSNLASIFKKSLQDLSPSNPFHLKPINDESEQTKNNSGEDRVVLYFTSLRGVRKTYEDCCHVREILKGLGIRVDERDVSMHSVFKNELKELIEDQDSKGMTLPMVFIGKTHIGGAEEIRRMHEEGNLEKEVENCERVEGSGGDGGRVCEACGDVRFLPCDRCSGSCKIYCKNEDLEKDDNFEDEDEENDYGFQRCPDCNENGLVRCPNCCA